jgi:hypothetical protein
MPNNSSVHFLYLSSQTEATNACEKQIREISSYKGKPKEMVLNVHIGTVRIPSTIIPFTNGLDTCPLL